VSGWLVAFVVTVSGGVCVLVGVWFGTVTWVRADADSDRREVTW